MGGCTEGGTYVNQTPDLNKNNCGPKFEQCLEGGVVRRFDLRIRRCISACQLCDKKGRKSGKRPSCARQREGEGGKT